MVVPLLNIPIVSVVFLLLAGILIGHLIWYRDRSDDEAIAVDLRSENSELQHALHQHKQAYVELQADMEDRRKGWEQLKATNLQLEKAQQSNSQDLSEINNELARLQQLKDQAFHDLDQERQQRRTLQEALTAAEQTAQRSASLNEQLQSQIIRLESKQQEIEQQTNSHAEEAALAAGLQDQLEDLQSQNESLVRERDALLHRAEAGKSDVHAIATLQNTQETLRTQLDDAKTVIATQQTELNRRDEDIASLRTDRDEVLQQIEDERESRTQVEQRLGNVQQLTTQRDEALQQQAELVEKLAAAETQITQLQADLEENSHELMVLQNSHEDAKLDLKQETDVLRQKLTALTTEHDAVSQVLIDERSRLSSMESENHRLAAMAAEAETIASSTNTDLQTNLSRKQLELDTLRTELEEIASQLGRERHQREHLQTVLHANKVQSQTLEQQRTEHEQQLQQAQAKAGSLEQRLTAMTAEMETLRETRVAEEEEQQTLHQRVSELNEKTSQLTSQLAQAHSQREEQFGELDRLQETHRTTLASRMELESAKDELEQQVRLLNREIENLRTSQAQNSDLTTRLDRVILQRDEAMHKHSQQEAQVVDLQSQLNDKNRLYDTAQQHVSELSKRVDDLEDVRKSYLQQQTQAHETGDRLRRVTVERDSQRDAIRIAEDRLSQLEARAKANEETIRNLRRERAAVLANTRQPSTYSFQSNANRSVPDLDSGGRMRRDDVLGMVYTQPPKQKDDLKRISGIAQVLEKKLNAFGVYTYRQIMEWDNVAISEFSKLLSFRDRIERDDWTGQARSLHFETYGRAA